MPTLEEMTAWSLDELEGEIAAALPKGLHFEIVPEEDGFWTVLFWRVDEATEGKHVVWEDTGPDQRLMMFNAYGWLWARQQPRPPAHSPWQPDRKEVTPELVRRHQAIRPGAPVIQGEVARGRSRASDPEDLDPAEVLSVYEQARKR